MHLIGHSFRAMTRQFSSTMCISLDLVALNLLSYSQPHTIAMKGGIPLYFNYRLVRSLSHNSYYLNGVPCEQNWWYFYCIWYHLGAQTRITASKPRYVQIFQWSIYHHWNDAWTRVHRIVYINCDGPYGKGWTWVTSTGQAISDSSLSCIRLTIHPTWLAMHLVLVILPMVLLWTCDWSDICCCHLQILPPLLLVLSPQQLPPLSLLPSLFPSMILFPMLLWVLPPPLPLPHVFHHHHQLPSMKI